MGVTERKPKSGKRPSTWCAQIRVQRDGVTVFSDSKTFARKAAAHTWHKKKKEELAKPGGLERAIAARAGALRPKLGDAIDRLVAESERELKKTKAQVLRALREDAIADMACENIRSDHIVDLAKRLLNGGRQTSTVGNYISHLSSVFTVARPAWGYPLDRQAMEDAAVVCKKLGYISKSKERDRRPTEAELDKLMTYFEARSRRRRRSAPMHRIIAFAILSTRRDSEICRILWDDRRDATAEQAPVILVREMKNPGDDGAVDIWCELTPEAMAIIDAMPRVSDRIFPYNPDTISAAFTRACKALGIEDLHFHDLRHEGVSWLIECGRSKEQAANVSGHQSWSSLQRYTNVRKLGNKYENWKWMPVVTEALRPASASAPSAPRRAARRGKQPGLRGRSSSRHSATAPSS